MTTVDVIGTVALVLLTVLKMADQVWASKDSRKEKIRRVAAQSFGLVEALAAAGRLGGDMTKSAKYFGEAAKLLDAMGEAPLTASEKRYLDTYAEQRAAAEAHHAGGVK